jgi:Lrp/AsnC family transcriptional regulator, leucine-responsive regulatory protein
MSMGENPNRRKRQVDTALDETGRKLLALLAENASLSYAEMGQILHLSPPAVHERVKQFRQDGTIKGTHSRLDPGRIGRPLLAFVHVFSKRLAAVAHVSKLSSLPDVEEIHSLTGDSGMLLKVRTRDTQSLEKLLIQIQSIEGIDSTRTHIALSTFLERGPSPTGVEN